MPPVENHHDDVIHFRLLQSLAESAQQNQRTLADALGVSLGKLNFCLRALVDKGWVKVGNFRRHSNKRQYAYLLTPQGIDAKARLTVHFLRHKMAEYDRLEKEIAELRRVVEEEGMHFSQDNDRDRDDENRSK